MRTTAALSLNEKRLIVLHELTDGGRKHVKFEDLAVGLWKRFPNDFHLKGYPQYPDSDLHRPLYSFRMKGLLDVKEKVFSLTDRGVTEAERTIRKAKGLQPEDSSHKLSRDLEKEIKRLASSEAFRLFKNSKKEEILDTDFYTFLGTTVRSRRSDFRGRMKAISDTIEEAKKSGAGKEVLRLVKELEALHEHLLNKFKPDIDYKLSNA